MRHRKRGKKLNRNSSHRHAMLRNMAVSLILSRGLDGEGRGRIITTLQKAKFLRPFIERLVTLSKRGAEIISRAPEVPLRRTPEWKHWRTSPRWSAWAESVSGAVVLRRRAFSLLRCDAAVSVLFESVAARFASRNGGYVRIVRLASRRVGDSGRLALIEFVGEQDTRA